MSEQKVLIQKHRLSRTEKYKNDKQYFKDQLDILDIESTSNNYGYGGISEYKRKKVNYDLNNNILDLSDFEYVCKPFGAEAGELPAQMVNRDIVSRKIKVMQGMEMKRPFSYKILATNREATTRREEEEFGKIKDFVVSSILGPIRQKIALNHQQELNGGQLDENQKAQIQAQMEQEFKAMTPDRVRRYMERDHQDPAEVLAQQLLDYLIQKQDVKRKFNTGWKHGLLSAFEVYWVGILNGEPMLRYVNPLRFSYDKSPDVEFIEDGEWAVCEYRMSPSDVVKYFGDELTKREIDSIYEEGIYYANRSIEDSLFNFEDQEEDNGNTIRVLHGTWKGLRELKFLTYLDDNNEEQVMIVDESYKLNFANGDIKLESEWIPEVYEGYKIGTDIYVHLREVPGQFRDMDNLYECKLPYIGGVYDNLNSQPTSLMDRLKVYQYYYNIVMYRLELLLASDKGKKILMNINAIPASSGIDIEQWQYFFESTPFMWFDPNEEGVDYADVNTMAKQIDLSLASDIQKYIGFAQYLKKEAGDSVGVTEVMEGQITPNEAVSNTRQNIVQSSNILEPYFDLHNHIKKNALQALLNTAKVAYSVNKPEKLSYVLDDLSVQILDMDINLLDTSTLGLFVANSAKAEEAKETIRQLAHAAMQNQKMELSDLITLIRQDGVQEAEETLKASEKKRIEREQASQERQNQFQASEAQKARDYEDAKMDKAHAHKIEEIETKGRIDIHKQTILTVGFNEDKDQDNDGQLDALEIAKHGVDAEIKRRKQDLDEKKFVQTSKENQQKIALEKDKLKDKTYGE